MARSIGQIKSFENGTFYVKDSKGNIHQLKAGDTIYEGDHVFGAQTNAAEAKIVIDVLLEGAGDVIMYKDGALTFDPAVMEGIFSSHAGIVNVNSNEEALALASMGEGEKSTVEAGDETAAGGVVTDTERMEDTFANRTGAITDVTSDLRPTSATIAETTIAPTEVTLVATQAVVTPGQPEQPEEPETMASVPMLDVALGEATTLPPIYSNEERYNLHQNNTTTGDIEFEGSATSVMITLKSFKTDFDDGQILLKDQNGGVIKTINIDDLVKDLNNEDVTVSVDAGGVPFYAIEVLNFIDPGDTNSEFKVDGIDAYAGLYQYPLDIIDASLSPDTAPGETLGDILVTGLPEGAVLSHAVYGDITVPEDGEVTFGSDTDFTSWTLTTQEMLPEESSIVASLTSTDIEGNNATAYVGVYGDNVIIGSEGADSLDGREGSDTLIAGEGNDTLVFDADDILIDGGLGTDTVILTGTTDIDFDAWNSESLKNIEIIDLTNGDHELSNLSLSDVVNMTDSNNDIYILGNAGDIVDFIDSEDWELSSTPVVEMINGTNYTFDVYTNAEDPTVTVKVEQAITDTI